MRENVLCAPIDCWFFRVIPKIAPNGTCDLFLMYVLLLILSLYLALPYRIRNVFKLARLLLSTIMKDIRRNTHTHTKAVFQGKTKYEKKKKKRRETIVPASDTPFIYYCKLCNLNTQNM